MAWETGTVINTSGSFSYAHQNFLEMLKNRLTSALFMGTGQAWTQLRYTTTGDMELILQGPGLSGTEQIFIGFKLYHDVTSDYYNMKVAGFTGYVSSNTFETQPGASGMVGVPLHNLSIVYWLVANAQRVMFVAKVGTPVYEMAYIGKSLPYATPSQYPYPLITMGMVNPAYLATRFSAGGLVSNTSTVLHNNPITLGGNNPCLQMRFVDGSWKTPQVHPWCNGRAYRDTNANSQVATGYYGVTPAILTDTGPNVYGEMDGVYHVTGFNNAVENTIVIGGVNYLVAQNVNNTGFSDYLALRLQ